MVVPTFYAYPNPIYQPAMRLVTGITNTNPAIVTTSFANNFLNGEIVRLYVPEDFGMYQMNQLFAPITVIDPVTFSIAIDATGFDIFSNPGNNFARTAMAIPIGEITSELICAETNTLPSGNR